MYRNMRWKLLYRLSEHGVSMNTFIKRIQGEEVTLLLVEDANKYKFGGFCTEEWFFSQTFYGTGENFMFTFRKEDRPEIWQATGDNSMY